MVGYLLQKDNVSLAPQKKREVCLKGEIYHGQLEPCFYFSHFISESPLR